jgi:hypothetical protein
MFDKRSGRYLHGPQWAKGYRGRTGIFRYDLAPDIYVTIHDSDPFWLALFLLNGEPVAGESCIMDHEAWVMRTRADAAFLNRLRTIVAA